MTSRNVGKGPSGKDVGTMFKGSPELRRNVYRIWRRSVSNTERMVMRWRRRVIGNYAHGASELVLRWNLSSGQQETAA